jgi:hypothetical protein
MALKKSFTDQYGNSAEYINISEYSVNYPQKRGTLKMAAYANKTVRKAGKLPIAEIEISVQDGNARLDEGGCVKTLRYVDCVDKTRTEMYVLIKVKKIAIHGQAVDLSKSTDLLD